MGIRPGHQLALGAGAMLLALAVPVLLWSARSLSSSPPGSARTLSGHSYWVTSVAWSPNSRSLVSGSSDRTVRVWDLVSGWSNPTLNSFQGGVNSVAWSPDGRYVATGSNEPNNTLRIWSTATWKPLFMVDPALNAPNEASINSLSWSPDGRRIAVGLQGSTTNGIRPDSWVKIYEVGSWQNTATLTYPDGVSGVVWSPDGKRVAFGAEGPGNSNLGAIVTWDPSSGSAKVNGSSIDKSNKNINILSISDGTVMSLAWSPNGKLIASAAMALRADEVRIWDATTGQNTATFTGHTATVQSVAWSPDSKRIASGGSDMTVKVWDIPSGKNTATFNHSDVVYAVAWSPDGRSLATACADRNVHIWNVK